MLHQEPTERCFLASFIAVAQVQVDRIVEGRRDYVVQITNSDLFASEPTLPLADEASPCLSFAVRLLVKVLAIFEKTINAVRRKNATDDLGILLVASHRNLTFWSTSSYPRLNDS